MIPKRVLVVDDSLYMRTLIKNTLSKAGYEIVGLAANGEQAIDMALDLQPDLITLDNILPDMIGLDILKVLKYEEKIAAKVVMVSAVGQETIIQRELRLGASAYLKKPFTGQELLIAINKVMSGKVALN